ncbi:MAG: hypothetical protein ACPGVU_05345 [Limisphaerales bacterium]
MESLFGAFASQEAFNAAVAAANSSVAATDSEASVNRILGVLSSQVSALSQAELNAISSGALSTGLVGGIISSGGSSTEAINAVITATQNLDPASQQAATQIAQSAAVAALAAQLTGASGNELLQAIFASLTGNGGGASGSISNGSGLSSSAIAVLVLLGVDANGGSTSASGSAGAAGATGAGSSTGGSIVP